MLVYIYHNIYITCEKDSNIKYKRKIEHRLYFLYE